MAARFKFLTEAENIFWIFYCFLHGDMMNFLSIFMHLGKMHKWQLWDLVLGHILKFLGEFSLARMGELYFPVCTALESTSSIA
jgi:hypothetical protein